MNRQMILGAAFALVFSAGAEAAEGWGIDTEKETRVEAKVVDLACEITGDCPADCGAGKRQLGLLMDDGKLVPVVKNFDIFAGATADLIEFCGERISADGLMISNPKMPMFALQFKKPEGGKWSRANWWGKKWSKANGGKPSNEWFKTDPVVINEIKTNGVFGIPGLKPSE